MQTQHGRSRDWSDPPNMGPNDPVPTATAQIPLRLQENLQLLDHMYPKTKVHTYVHTYACMYIHAYIRLHTHTYLQTHTHTRAHTLTHTHTLIYTHIHLHTYAYTNTSTFYSTSSDLHYILYNIHSIFSYPFHIQFLLSILCPLLSQSHYASASLLIFFYLSSKSTPINIPIIGLWFILIEEIIFFLHSISYSSFLHFPLFILISSFFFFLSPIIILLSSFFFLHSPFSSLISSFIFLLSSFFQYDLIPGRSAPSPGGRLLS